MRVGDTDEVMFFFCINYLITKKRLDVGSYKNDHAKNQIVEKKYLKKNVPTLKRNEKTVFSVKC